MKEQVPKQIPLNFNEKEEGKFIGVLPPDNESQPNYKVDHYWGKQKKKMDSKKEKKAWREVKYDEKFLNAFRGMRVFWNTTRNLSVHILAALVVIVAGFYFNISGEQWAMLIFAIGFVIVSEAFNTAIEIDIDLTSPEYHPYARDTKDVAAAAVLLSAIIAIIVGMIIFLPKIF